MSCLPNGELGRPVGVRLQGARRIVGAVWEGSGVSEHHQHRHAPRGISVIRMKRITAGKVLPA